MKKVHWKSEIIKNIVSVSGIVVFAKLLGFIKQMIIAGSFGATLETDLISLSQGLIGNMEYFLVQVFIVAFIPIYTEAKSENREKAYVFVSNVLIMCMIAFSFIIAALFVAAPAIARVIAPSYTSQLCIRLTHYIRIYTPMLFLTLLCTIFNALLRANKHFLPGELVSVIQSIILIGLTLLLSERIGAKTLVVSYFVYTVINAVFLCLAAKKEWKFKRAGKLYDRYSAKLLKMAYPLFFGYAMVFINQQVDKVIVSGLGEGVVTAVDYAAVLSNLIATLTGSICSVIFPYISQYVADGWEEEAGNLIRRSAVLFTTFLVPICVLILFNARDIVKTVYGRGAFSDSAVRNTAIALTGYSVSIVFYAYKELFSRLQYSYHDSRRPMINSSIGIFLNIVCSIILSRFWGVFGVTIASSFSTIICAILNIVSARKHNNYIKASSALRYLPYWTLGGFVCAFFSIRGADILADINAVIRFVIISGISLVVYLIICIPIFYKARRDGGWLSGLKK